MKTFILFFAALSQVSSSLVPSCTIDSSVASGTNSVILTLHPSPLEILDAAGLGNSKSPTEILNLLDGPSNPLTSVVASINSTLRAFTFGLVQLPACRFKFISSQLFCDNVPANVLNKLCVAVPGAISKITKPISFPLPQPQNVPLTCENNTWGIDKMNVQAAWDAGFKGQNVIVANIDSGVRSTHNELKGNYRSQYGWYDATNKSNTIPKDDNGHGTHTMGSMVGKTIGAAPSAQWIACKACQANKCDNEPLLDCATWLLCPDNKALNCTTRPKVINNSWGGGMGDYSFNAPLAIMAKFGIINFFSSGNSGSACMSVVSPADGDSETFNFLAVGATACNENIASYSSNGPSQAANYMGKLKPDIVAPGSNIYSAWNTDDDVYQIESGTSMSSPNAAGAAILLLSRNPTLTYEQISYALRNGAYRNPDVQSNVLSTCNLTIALNASPWPNNIYGYGRVDVGGAMQLL